VSSRAKSRDLVPARDGDPSPSKQVWDVSTPLGMKSVLHFMNSSLMHDTSKAVRPEALQAAEAPPQVSVDPGSLDSKRWEWGLH